VRWLREKLEEDPANPKLIQTVRGVDMSSAGNDKEQGPIHLSYFHTDLIIQIVWRFFAYQEHGPITGHVVGNITTARAADALSHRGRGC